MSDAFDPYYIWLGIPPEDQPPNHYRLLGIEIFEANREVIEAAANRQMNYLQEISSGEEHINEAQKILGELSRARICLLNAEKKAAYDEQLRESFDALTAAPEPEPPATTPVADEPLVPPTFGLPDDELGVDEADESVGPPAVGLPQPPHAAKAKKPSLVPIIVLAVVALALIGGITFYLIGEANKQEEQLAQVAEEEAADKAAKEEADRIAKEEADRKAKEEADRKAKEEADRKAKEEADRKAKEKADRIAKEKEDAERKEKEEADRVVREKKAQEAKEADRKAKEKEEADEFLIKKGLELHEDEWWPAGTYTVVQKFNEQSDLLNRKFYKQSPKQFWKKVSDLVKKQAEIQGNFAATADDLKIRSPLKKTGLPLAEPPPVPSRLTDIATDALRNEGLQKREDNIWRLKEQEAKLKTLKDAESHPNTEMLKDFNPEQQKLLTEALQIYQQKTKAEWDKLLTTGEKLAGQPGKVGFHTNGKNEYGEVGWARFNFLSSHHPDVDVSSFGWPKKDVEAYREHALKFCLTELQKNKAWKTASNKRSKANAFQKKISKRYKKLERDTEAAVALRVVGGHLPTETEKDK